MDNLDKIMKTRAERSRVETQTGRRLGHDEQVGTQDAPAEILGEDGDPKKKLLVSMLLRTLVPNAAEQDDLQERFKNNGPFTDRQLKLMQDLRYEFNERYMLLSEAERLFSADELQHIANKHSGYGKYMAGFTPERAKELTDMHFAHLAMGNVASLRRMVNEKKAIEERKQTPEYKQLMADVDWAMKVAGLSAEEISATVDLRDRAGSEARLQEKIKEAYAKIPSRPIRWFKQVRDWAFNTSATTARSAFDAVNDTERSAVSREINRNINTIGLVLMGTIQRRTDFIASLSQELWGGKKVEWEGIEQVTSAGQIEEKKGALSDDAVRTKFRSERDAVTQKRFNKNWHQLTTDADRDLVRTDFLDKLHTESQSKGSGMFASILARFVGTLFGAPAAPGAAPGRTGSMYTRGDLRTLLPNDPQARARKKKR